MGISSSTDSVAATRRSVVKGAAWSVPAVIIASAAPTVAASGGNASVVGSCDGNGPSGSITVSVTGLATGAVVRFTLEHSGSGSFSVATVPDGWRLVGPNTYEATATEGQVEGTFDVHFTLSSNQTGTVRGTVSAASGAPITGDLAGFVTKRRDGNSGNYNQCSTG